MATDRPQGFNELKNEKPPLIYYLHNASEGTVKLQHAPDG